MKSIKNLLLLTIVFAFGMTSCTDDEPNPTTETKQIAYILNYGGYGAGNTQIDMYDLDSAVVTKSIYQSANGVGIGSNVQSISIFDDVAYFMSNGGDKIDITNAKDLKAITNPISGVVKPRYAVEDKDNVYISCWGGNDFGVFADSYIAVLNKNTYEITKINIPGGLEGLIIVDKKLYSALSVKNQVAVTDLITKETSYIHVSALPQHIVKDANGNLCVSLINDFSSTYSVDSIGVAVINTNTNKVEKVINLTSMSYPGYIKTSNDAKILYTITNDSWPGKGSYVYTFDLNDYTVSENPMITGEGFTGIDVNPKNNDLFICVSPDAVSNGEIKVYDKTGSLKVEFDAGIYPQQVVFYNVEK